MGKKGETTKSLITAKAIELFRERGFQEVTIDDICRAADITRGTYYYHFKSKDDVLLGFYDEPEAISIEQVSDVLEATNYWDQIWLCYSPFIEYSQQAGAEVLAQCMRINLSENHGTFDPRASTFKLATPLIKKGQEAGEIRNKTAPETLHFIAVQILIAYDFQWAIHKESFEKKAAMRGALEILFDVESSLRKGGSPEFPTAG